MRFNLKSLPCAFFPGALGLLLGCLLFSTPAYAEVKPYPSCDRDPTENDISAAKGAYEAGQVSFQEADYERALLYWEDAFRRDCTAVKLLLNIARAYELSENREAAVNALQTYIDRKPDAKDRGSVEKRIAKLKEQIEEEAATPVATETPSETTNGDSDAEPVAATTPPVEPAPRAKKPSWPVWLTAGGIVVALLGHGSVARGELLRQDKAEEYGCDLETRDCSEAEGEGLTTSQIEDDVNETGARERSTGAALATVGHLAGITGGIFWWILWTQEPKGAATGQVEPKTMLRPVIAPGFQGFSFSGRF